MKKVLFSGLALVAVLAFSLFAWSGPSQAAPVVDFATMPSWDLSFDGYCDGVHLDYPGTTGAPISGYQTGCVTGNLFGSVSFAPNTAHLSYAPAASFNGLHTIIYQTGTWAHYNESGFVNSGTWSLGLPRNAKAPASFGR